MKVSTKERLQGNTKSARAYKNLQARVRRLTQKVERQADTICSQADHAKKARNEIEQLKIENELLRMRLSEQEQQREPTEHSSQLGSFCNERGVSDHTRLCAMG